MQLTGGASGAGRGRNLYAKVCVSLLAVLMIIISVQNGQYFVRGYYLHFLPMLLVCAIAWLVLRDAAPPRPAVVGWTLSVVAVVCVALELGFHVYKRKPFDEDGVLTLLSFSLLLLTSFTTLRIWLRRKVPGPLNFRDQGTIWLLIAVGFLYLAVDEKSLLHEGMDRSLHTSLDLVPTAWTSRLDDLLIGLYGLGGIGFLWWYRAEVKRFPGCLRLLKVGFVALFLSVAADTASNRNDLFVWMLGEDSGMVVYELMGEIEEVLKATGEILFLTGFSSVLYSVSGENAVPVKPE
jgi:hypothetical protein